METPSVNPQEIPSPGQGSEAEHAAVIEQLLKVARKKGNEQAILEAQKLNNPHILDELHDRLAETTREKNTPSV